MENVRKELTRKIVTICKANETPITKDSASFLLSLYQLNPSYRIKEKDEEHNARILEAITERLCDQSKPSLTTLRNQLYFTKHYHERDETVKRHRLRLHQKTGPLVAEICETGKLRGAKDTEKLYQKILTVITLLSGLGSPTIPSVLREVSVALQSVFQTSELTRYVTLPKREKEEQLMELMCIVAGIRLFNKDCQRGGEEIDDLPSILQEALTKTRNSILELLEPLMGKVYKFTAAVENAVACASSTVASSDAACYSSRGAVATSVASENIEWAIEMLAASRQQEIYIRKLLNDVESSENAVRSLMERLRGRFFKLHDTVRYRTAIPTAQVYPQFIDLADIWMGLQDEVITLSNVNNFLWELQSLSNKTVNVYDQTKLDDIAEDADVLSDAERLERSMGNLITECGECQIYYPNVTKDFEKINLEFLGFCAWTFIVGKGALIPGNPNNGVAKWRGKYYAFKSSEAAVKFGENPDRYVYEALDFIRNHPEYIHLFKLHEEIEAMQSQEEFTKEGLHLKVRHNQKVQTDVHTLPPYVDKDYTSSIWELKRRALHLANISRCTTRSTQTFNSHFRYAVYAQAAPPQDKEVQTRRDNYTNTKSLKTFIFGLRGRRDDNQHVISFLEDELEHL
ncbi:LOW QUALITY PROTEIN: cilia- and flagella-associated protein 206 [Harpegnathos saltator]|uniref:LOW QUALITY PROTEIN: cilia- and flagella-associated protein 206 n=1 Tax=Harpegnathos saltator TaxID=610380 RepID=UPI0009491F87|nr:LOW QUALITY PROTEIN: cilia- and flagella-associated protein 206 [Harpegnathos saltator]